MNAMRNKNREYNDRRLEKPDMKKEKNYTQFPNAFILNRKIGDSELRLLLFIMMNKNGYKIKIENCVKYLKKTKQAIYPQLKKLIELGVIRITDEIIEVIIPDEMKKYKFGYLDCNQDQTSEVKKNLPQESDKSTSEGQENLTIEVKETLPSKKENLTTKSIKSDKKPLENIDKESVGDAITLNNTTRVLPVPATGGSTGQPHSNKTTEDLGVSVTEGVDKVLASPSVLAPSPHPSKGKEDSSKSLQGNSNDSTNNADTLPKSNPLNTNIRNSENQMSSSAKNDLKLVYDSITHFKIIYDNAEWHK